MSAWRASSPCTSKDGGAAELLERVRVRRVFQRMVVVRMVVNMVEAVAAGESGLVGAGALRAVRRSHPNLLSQKSWTTEPLLQVLASLLNFLAPTYRPAPLRPALPLPHAHADNTPPGRNMTNEHPLSEIPLTSVKRSPRRNNPKNGLGIFK